MKLKIRMHLFCFKEDDNFPGYVKLSLAEVNKSSPMIHFTIMNDDKLYFSNSVIMDSLQKHPFKIPKPLDRIFDSSPKRDRNGPAYTMLNKDHRGLTNTSDAVYCIHYDVWPNSANTFITRSRPNN